MAQYLLSVCFDGPYDDQDLSTPENQHQMALTGELTTDMERAGAWVFHAGLESSSTASVARVVDGAAVVTDGPYAETKEQMAGFWVIEAPDLDAAQAWAARAAVACGRPIEVRPAQS